MPSRSGGSAGRTFLARARGTGPRGPTHTIESTKRHNPIRRRRLKVWRGISELAFSLAWITAISALILALSAPWMRKVVFWLMVGCYTFFGIGLSYRGGAWVLGALAAGGAVWALDQWLGWAPLIIRWGSLGLGLAVGYALWRYVRGKRRVRAGD